MVTDYAILLELPPRQRDLTLAYRSALMALGGIPCPFPGGWLLGRSRHLVSLTGKGSLPLAQELPLGHWQLRLGPSGFWGDYAGISAEPETFFGLFGDTAVFRDGRGHPLPTRFIPLVRFPSGLSDTLTANTLPPFPDFGKPFSKLLLSAVRLEYPRGEELAAEALVWYRQESLTILPADHAYR